ncbi:disulfide oxidoreductase [Heyndrickxia sp. NPDC080065]|uniref:disulfide oxidoreductase n=1 Tax=Heyndrickxia sp. NPDC080065 TaxID=3390568 RepID=UPI003D0730E4
MHKNDKIRDNLWLFAWTVSIIALLGSLYFSEVRHFNPCKLCWYQRILMYPLTIIIGMSVFRRDYRISIYIAVLSGIGMITSLYHYSIQKVPFLSSHAPACGPISCTGEYINWLGFITIPFLALIAFIIIFISSIIVFKLSKND